MRLVPNNWLYNAGLVGLLRLLQAKSVDIEARMSDGGFELHSEDLDEFADAYCRYVLQSSIGKFIPSLDQRDRGLLDSFGRNYTEIRANCIDLLNQELQSKTRIEEAEQEIEKAVNSIVAKFITGHFLISK